MGMVICPKHGNQIVSFVSPKVADYVINNKKIDFEAFTLKLNPPDGKPSSHIIDEEFFATLQQKFGLEINDKVANDEEMSFEIFCELKSVCPECLKQAYKAQ